MKNLINRIYASNGFTISKAYQLFVGELKMGMFDSFYIEKDGKNHEVQSKQLECNLDCYSIGDTVPSLHHQKSFVVIEDEWVKDSNDLYYGFIIYNNIFIDYIDFGEDKSKIEEANQLLQTYINNPKLANLKLVDILHDKNNLLDVQYSKLNAVERIVREYIRFKSGQYNDSRFSILFHNFEYYENGGTMEDLIVEKLKIEILD